MQKRVLTIQDYSCLGRCSLTVALPILSALGHECVGIPTAVLSNHTAFSSWTYTDLTNEMLPIVEKWKNYDHNFDLILTGYLGNGQAETVKKVITKVRTPATKLLVDPAFADDGKLYAGFDFSHVEEMLPLVKKADIIVPNVTEACYLLGIDPLPNELGEDRAAQLLKSLGKLGPDTVIITGITKNAGKDVGEAIYDKTKDQVSFYYTHCFPGKYHGAGDVFAAALAGCLLKNITLKRSVDVAHDFVHHSMFYNLKDEKDGLLYGLEFERAIPYLLNKVLIDKKSRS